MKEFWNIIQAEFAVVGGWLGWFLGGADGLMYALILFVVYDYITGVGHSRRRVWPFPSLSPHISTDSALTAPRPQTQAARRHFAPPTRRRSRCPHRCRFACRGVSSRQISPHRPPQTRSRANSRTPRWGCLPRRSRYSSPPHRAPPRRDGRIHPPSCAHRAGAGAGTRWCRSRRRASGPAGRQDSRSCKG